MRRALLSVAAGLIVLGTTAAAHADEWEHSYPITRTTPLRLKTGDAEVRLHAGPAGSVRMHVHTHNLTIGRRLMIDVSDAGGGWTAEVRERPQMFGFHFDIGPRVVVELEVPSDCQLAVVTGDGGIQASDIGGQLDLHTGDGGIHADRLRGAVHLDTGDGGVVVHELDGQLVAHSGDGHMHLDGRFDHLDVTTGDGPVQIDVGSGSHVAQGWSIQTGDGGVRLRLPNDLRADLHAHTGDGGITMDLPVEVSGQIGHHDLRGTLHGGGGLLEVRSGDGSIHIMPL